jgi:hypothetical protein
MDLPDDPQERKRWMMEVLQDYGREFLIFEPEDQPNVFAALEPEYRDLRSWRMYFGHVAEIRGNARYFLTVTAKSLPCTGSKILSPDPPF